MFEYNRARSLLNATLIAVLTLLFLAVTLAWADSELPPRPPVPATPVSEQGGTIKLVVSDTQIIMTDTHTTVEWRNGFGEWEEVETWRATFGHSREIVWWVSPEHMGQQNYRWVVIDADGAEITVSAEFDLPTHSWEPKEVWVGWGNNAP